jgi:hypothetical protein
MLLTQQVKMKWNGNSKKYYEEKGYVFTKNNDIFVVKIDEVQEGSSVSVEVKCDDCGSISRIIYSSYTRRKKDPSYCKDLCKSCSQKGKISKNKLSINVIREKFEERGYLLISTSYERSNKKLIYACRKHIDKGNLETTWNNFNSGHGCKYCGQERSKQYSSYIFRNIQDIDSFLKYSVEKWFEDSRAASQSKCYITGVACHYVCRLFNIDEMIEEIFSSLEIKKKEIVFEYTKIELEKLQDKILEMHYQKGLGVCLSKEAFELYVSVYKTKHVTQSKLDELKARFELEKVGRNTNKQIAVAR